MNNKSKTEDDKVKELEDFFEEFCLELSKRNEGYSFWIATDVRKNYLQDEIIGYNSFLAVEKKTFESGFKSSSFSSVQHFPSFQNGVFYGKPKKSKLNSLRSLFRSIFSGNKILLYNYSGETSERLNGCTDLSEVNYSNIYVSARFEKCRNLIEAKMKLVLDGFLRG